MEKHGITFKDYALASANIAGGMSEEQVCEVLGIEVPVWQEVVEFFNNEMSKMEPEDMNEFAQYFVNPKQGKFANVEGGAGGTEQVLAKYPEWSDYIKIMQHQAVASDNGINLDLEKEYGITITEFSQLGMHWSAYLKEKVMEVEDFDEYAFKHEGGPAITPEQEERQRVFWQHHELMEYWQNHFEELYKNAGAGLSDDIDF